MCILIEANHLLRFMVLISIAPISALVKFAIPKSDVVHTKSGLIFHYLSEYRPANEIISFTVTIPMYLDMCYLVPSVAMGKIKECFDKEAGVRQFTAYQQKLQRINKTLFFDKEAQLIRSSLGTLFSKKPMLSSSARPTRSPNKQTRQYSEKRRVAVEYQETRYRRERRFFASSYCSWSRSGIFDVFSSESLSNGQFKGRN